jgi:hypothetical protein
MEGLREVPGGFVERQVMDGGPQVEHVAVRPAVGVDRKGTDRKRGRS